MTRLAIRIRRVGKLIQFAFVTRGGGQVILRGDKTQARLMRRLAYLNHVDKRPIPKVIIKAPSWNVPGKITRKKKARKLMLFLM